MIKVIVSFYTIINSMWKVIDNIIFLVSKLFYSKINNNNNNFFFTINFFFLENYLLCYFLITSYNKKRMRLYFYDIYPLI